MQLKKEGLLLISVINFSIFVSISNMSILACLHLLEFV